MGVWPLVRAHTHTHMRVHTNACMHTYAHTPTPPPSVGREARNGPFDLFIDAANVAFFGQNFAGGGFNWRQVKRMVRKVDKEHPHAKLLVVSVAGGVRLSAQGGQGVSARQAACGGCGWWRQVECARWVRSIHTPSCSWCELGYLASGAPGGVARSKVHMLPTPNNAPSAEGARGLHGVITTLHNALSRRWCT